MEDENEFGNCPFSRLDAKNFPSQPGPSPEMADDRALFLAELNKPAPDRKADSPFLLGDCWKKLSGKKKGSKTKPVISPPAPPPKPAKAKPAHPEENEFLLAMRNTVPLKPGGREVARPAQPLPEQAKGEPGFADLLAENPEFDISNSDEYLEGKVSGLDESLMNRLRMGQLSPEAHLDLHGLNSLQAFESLREFIRSSWFKGLRVVLLVPGRGLNSPNGRGILRQKLQTWLTQEPFKRVVLAFCTAQPHDGGPGSVYTLLRRYRKKGRIQWNCLPADADLYNWRKS